MVTTCTIAILLCLLTCAQTYKYYTPVRYTKYGNIQGKITFRYEGTEVEEYLGVPYAAPPVGNLRFKRPQPPQSWRGHILQTLSLPPACPTFDLDYIQFHKPGFNDRNEDCLFMNLYVPMVNHWQLLPVLVFIHGGSNADGMGALFDGDLLAAHGKMIVVTFNYRVSALGFYADPSKGVKGNNGLMDQVLAMKWIQDNIHFLGGDKNQVTLYGHSAGAGDIGLHLMSDLSQGLFKNVIIHSGSPLAFWLASKCVKSMNTLTVPKSCKRGFSPITRATSAAEKLLSGSNVKRFFSSITYGEDVFKVVVDGEFLKDSPAKLLSCGQFNANNVMLIMAKDEGVFGNILKMEKFYSRTNVTSFIKETKHMFPEKNDVYGDDVIKAVNKWKKAGISRFPEYLHLKADIEMFGPMVKFADFLRKKTRNVYMLSFEYHTEKWKKPVWTEEDVYKMLKFLINNIFVQCGGRVFQQTVDIPMGANCAPLLADLFLHSYEADFITDLIRKKEYRLAKSFNLSFRYIDGVLSLNNPNIRNLIHRIYPKELEIKHTTDTVKSASYLDLRLEINDVQHGWDLFYVFGVPLVGHHVFPYTPRDAEVSKTTMTIISDFVKTGHLMYNHRRMQRYSAMYRSYNMLGYINGRTVLTKKRYFRKPRIEFWNKYLFAYTKFQCPRYSKY